MTTTLFRNDSLRIAAGLISCALFALAPACSDDSNVTYSVPAAAGTAGTVTRGSGTLIPAAPGGGVPDVNDVNNLNAGSGGLPGTGATPGYSTAGTAGSFGYASGGAAGAPNIGSAGVAGMAGTAGFAGMGGASDLLP